MDKKTKAFLDLIEANKGILYKVANSYCQSEEDRKDLIQEIVIQLWQSFDKYDPKYKHSTWIYRIALNVSISFYRKTKRRSVISNPISTEIIHALPMDEGQADHEDLKHLHQFIAELKELDKALILLFLEGKSQKEVAEILGISLTNTSTKMARIKQKLKEKFSKIKN